LDAAGLSKTHAAEQLLEAVLTAGGPAVDRENAAATIDWGLEKGKRSPLNPGRR